jgi:hypothetical protein
MKDLYETFWLVRLERILLLYYFMSVTNYHFIGNQLNVDTLHVEITYWSHLNIAFLFPCVSLTTRKKGLLEKIIITQLLMTYHAFYGVRKFIIMFAKPHDWTLSWARLIHFTACYHIHLRYISVRSIRLPTSPRRSLPSRHPNQSFLCISHLSPFPAHVSWLCHPNSTLTFLSFSLWNTLHRPLESSLLHPNVLLSILFSSALNLYPSVRVSHQFKFHLKWTIRKLLKTPDIINLGWIGVG